MDSAATARRTCSVRRTEYNICNSCARNNCSELPVLGVLAYLARIAYEEAAKGHRAAPTGKHHASVKGESLTQACSQRESRASFPFLKHPLSDFRKITVFLHVSAGFGRGAGDCIPYAL
jgi:hypothetical protein